MPFTMKFESSQDYAEAGVRVNVSLEKPSNADEARFAFTMDDLASGRRLDFLHETCPALHDFSRGYTRWMATKGISASRGEDAISGTARADATPGGVQGVLQEAVDMADQKFSNYRDQGVHRPL